jgi:2-dehydro-3-deoxyglucarate aldolase/4-hydroxy-2-oxoheptanedioate aldolase
MNKPGAFGDPDFLKHESASIAAARKHGKSAGRLGVDARQCADFLELGYDFVAIAGDVWLLQQAFAAGVATIRKG